MLLLLLLSGGWLLLALLWLYSNCDCGSGLVLFFLRYVAQILILGRLVLSLAAGVEELSAHGYPSPLGYVRPRRVLLSRFIRGRWLLVISGRCRRLLRLLLATTGHSSQSSVLLIWFQLAVGVEDGRKRRSTRPTLRHDVWTILLLFLWSRSRACSCIGIGTRRVCTPSRVRRTSCICCSSGGSGRPTSGSGRPTSGSSRPTSGACCAILVSLDPLVGHGRPGNNRLSYACRQWICVVIGVDVVVGVDVIIVDKLWIVFCGGRLIRVVRVLHFIHLLLLLVTMEVDMFFILNVELSTLQIDVVDIKVILVELHMDHLLSLLIHLVFFQTLINLVYLFADL